MLDHWSKEKKKKISYFPLLFGHGIPFLSPPWPPAPHLSFPWWSWVSMSGFFFLPPPWPWPRTHGHDPGYQHLWIFSHCYRNPQPWVPFMVLGLHDPRLRTWVSTIMGFFYSNVMETYDKGPMTTKTHYHGFLANYGHGGKMRVI